MTLPMIPFSSQNENAVMHLRLLKNITSIPELRHWEEDHRLILDGHGTRGRYMKGCPCSWCREAERVYRCRRKGVHARRRRTTHSDRHGDQRSRSRIDRPVIPVGEG